jgi:hypothetical protein
MPLRKRTVRGVEREQNALYDRLKGAYTPDIPIVTPALFSGREDLLERARNLLGRPGATLVLFGDRGIGKTSFCNVLLYGKQFRSRQASAGKPEELFVDILSDLGVDLTVAERSFTGRGGISSPLKLEGEVSQKQVPIAPRTSDVNLMVNRLARSGLDAVVIDEVQEIRDSFGRLWLASLAKAWSDAAAPPLLVLIGVGHDARDLLGDEVEHYGARHLHPEEILPLSREEAADILAQRTALGIRVLADAERMVLDIA